ncbi:VWA domain-containing protein [Virgibacillus sp. MSP4-1]|uniref:vWA domain-containing protein n=1 Tax=Virgibacillus sp. MSP4-1 TaxID=2700081 RepID=UPI0003A0DF26|nr:VWA domain-containing protein [Virgibacillus sp. MSP4-1]QHS21776.1 VWA domain-containing protein [Virgibacillus sp. MSP4-1]
MVYKNGSRVLVIGLFLLFFISACNPEMEEESIKDDQKDRKDEEVREEQSDEEEGESNQSNTHEENILKQDVPSAPSNLPELINYPAGPFAGKSYEDQMKQIERALDSFPELVDEEPIEAEVKLYWEQLLALFAEDFPDPANVVKKWEAFSFGNPESTDPKLQFKENYNVEIVLDASGSMGAYAGSKTRMELAKDAIREFAQQLPEDANVGLRVYGYKGTGSEADKEKSCNSNELFYDIQPYDEKVLRESMEKFKPAGWTPLADAITLAMRDLHEYDGEHNTNIIYIVSDGIETCNGNPVEAAENLATSDIMPIVNVIGLDVNSDGQKQLKNIADVSNGTYSLVKNQNQLTEEFQRTRNMADAWQEWKLDAKREVRQTSVDRMNMIRDFRGEWADRWKRERHSFHEAFEYLESNDYISREVSSALYDLRDERIDMITDNLDKIWDDLYALKEKQISEAKKLIEEQYSKHSDE